MFVEATRRQRDRGVQVWLVGMNPGVLAMVQRSPLGKMLGREGMHFNLEIAVTRYLGAQGPAGSVSNSQLETKLYNSLTSEQQREVGGLLGQTLESGGKLPLPQ
jgi:hypothetical protein